MQFKVCAQSMPKQFKSWLIQYRRAYMLIHMQIVKVDGTWGLA